MTIVYPAGAPNFWEMMCGEFGHVIIDVQRRPVEQWLVDGDYQADREFRQAFHHWLGEVWKDKDEAIERLGA